MTTARPLRFGAFLVPLHDINEKPTLSLWRDLQLIELLDELDYDEAWVGEHHSGGWANVLAPELVIAAAAERTKHIKLASGVISLPYHNPFMVATRAVQPVDAAVCGRITKILACPGAMDWKPTDCKICGHAPASSERTA